MSGRDANVGFAAALVDEWVRAGLTDAVVAPGSRSAPLALALARDDRIRVHVVLDERSAAFLALGLGRATGRPAVVLCTSGTAAANLAPAVVEAHHGRVPLLVCTADRPPELHDTGAPQTVDQARLFGTAPRWYVEPGPPEDRPGAGRFWRSLACRAHAEAVGPPAGPVHLNLAFREPLVPTGPPVDAPGRPDGRPWTTTAVARGAPDDDLVDRLVRWVDRHPRGLLVAGWGAGVDPEAWERLSTASGWPVLADAVSGLRTGEAVTAYEALLRAGLGARYRPGAALRVGAPLTSKVAASWLDEGVEQVVVDPDRARLDPERVAAEHVVADPGLLVEALVERLEARPPGAAEARRDWRDAWRRAEARARPALDVLLDRGEGPVGGRVARDLVAALPAGTGLVVASSLAVREAEWFAPCRSGLHPVASRGANGIDGFTSTALGVALGSGSPTVGLTGDLCFLHDTNGLLGAADRGVDLVLVVVDDDGGGIFSLLPVAALPEHDRLFAAPHGVDLVAVAAAHGVPAREVEPEAAAGAVLAALEEGGVHAVVVPARRDETARRVAATWRAVAEAVEGL